MGGLKIRGRRIDCCSGFLTQNVSRQAFTNGIYTIENVNANGKFLNVHGYSTYNWANVYLWDNPTAASTQWRVKQAGESM